MPTPDDTLRPPAAPAAPDRAVAPVAPAFARPARRPWQAWVVTVGGSGMLPCGPGTWGSLATCIVLLILYVTLFSPTASGAGGAGGFAGSPQQWFSAAWPVALIAGLTLSSILSVAMAPWAIRYYGREDPGSFVLDEAAGICLTLMGLPMRSGWGEAWIVLAAFTAFRVFDIWKPPPARQLERFPAGWGILLDDLAAAVYANLLCQAVLRGLLKF